MLVVKTVHDLRALMSTQVLPKLLMDYLEEFFYEVYDGLGGGAEIEEFTLGQHGGFYICEPSKDHPDPLIPGYGRLGSVLPEYVERVNLSGTWVYKVAIMPENDAMAFVFCMVDEVSADVADWLEEYLESAYTA